MIPTIIAEMGATRDSFVVGKNLSRNASKPVFRVSDQV